MSFPRLYPSVSKWSINGFMYFTKPVLSTVSNDDVPPKSKVLVTTPGELVTLKSFMFHSNLRLCLLTV